MYVHPQRNKVNTGHSEGRPLLAFNSVGDFGVGFFSGIVRVVSASALPMETVGTCLDGAGLTRSENEGAEERLFRRVTMRVRHARV